MGNKEAKIEEINKPKYFKEYIGLDLLKPFKLNPKKHNEKHNRYEIRFKNLKDVRYKTRINKKH